MANDIATTQGYLAQIKDNTVTEARIQARVNAFKGKVEVKMKDLENEIMNDANPGFGPVAKRILSEFATMLDVPKVEPLSYTGTSQQDRQRLCNAYRRKIFQLRDAKTLNIRSSMTPPNDNYRRVAERDWKNIEEVRKNIGDAVDLNDADDMKDVCDRLNQGYATIKTYKQFVQFSGNADRATYTAESPQTRVSRMLSVYDVWRDFLTGREGGLAFTFWIIISILVDLAAFIFFDIAFRKRD